MKTFILLIILFTPTLSFASAEYRQTMKCNSMVVSIGNSFQDVKNKCGEPTSIQTTYRAKIWVYDFGANEFIYMIYLDSGGFVNAIVNTGNHGNNK